MILLDTNVLAELMRPSPNAHVLEWFASKSAASLFTTSITEAEIRFGLAILPLGRRRRDLQAAVDAMFAEDLATRVLPFDSAAAAAFAKIAASRRKAGRPIAQLDAQIAAIARAHHATLATRNMRDFAGCGIDRVNPWRR